MSLFLDCLHHQTLERPGPCHTSLQERGHTVNTGTTIGWSLAQIGTHRAGMYSRPSLVLSKSGFRELHVLPARGEGGNVFGCRFCAYKFEDLKLRRRGGESCRRECSR